MKASNTLWRKHLAGRMPPHLEREIEVFDEEITLRKQGKIDEKVFAETRLRRGCYGQRYDNGQRHDGLATRTISYPSGDLTKGPNTLWDAPGMQRIKVPYGGLDAAQLEVLAQLAEEYADGIAHVTTRQDFQLHFVHIDDTPAIMRRLAAVGITTREACGNSVRNVTGCPLAGVCRDEVFDVTPYAKACAYFLLGHPDCQDFGRKFKISFSGCRDKPCALARIHDIGLIAAVREENGRLRRGFEMYVGGGLGPVPYQAKLFTDFLPAEELLPTAQSIARVFARLGEKKNRNRARMKFLVEKLGLEEFRRLVAEERAALAPDPAWTSYLPEAELFAERPSRPPTELVQLETANGSDFHRWLASNVYRQRQPGYAAVTVRLPLGDITSHQLRRLADIARKYTPETVRTTIEQNIVLRWVSEGDLSALYEDLKQARLASLGANTIRDITACPGTDTCKLGISASRGLARELERRIGDNGDGLPDAARDLRIKISGCFNSCGQHHVADLGFYGVSRNKHGYTVPHFQVLLGGQWSENGAAYGLPIVAIPSKRIPEAVERITRKFAAEHADGETFQQYVQRTGKAALKAALEDLADVPPHESDPSFYTDWGDAREYTTDDIGVGECAGEVVSPVEFQLAACERELFEAQLALERGEAAAASRLALAAMLNGARALLGVHNGAGADDSRIVEEFREKFYDTQLFFDPFVGGAFANYFFRAWESRHEPASEDSARRLLSEAQLFLDACHSCRSRIAAASAKK